MKNAMLILFLVAMVVGAMSADAAVTKPNRVAGQIHQIDRINGVTTLNITDGVKAVILTCNAETKVNRDGDKTALKLDDLQVGQQIRAYYTSANVALHVHISKIE